jgi:hypothetical protein
MCWAEMTKAHSPSPVSPGFCYSDAVPLAKALGRVAIRRRFEEHFSIERMVHDYLALYDGVLCHGIADAVTSPSFGTRRQRR